MRKNPKMPASESTTQVRKKHAGGRPRTPINLDELEKLSRLHCTMEEYAAYLGCDVRTIQLRAHNDPEVRTAIEKGRAMGKLGVRRQQFRLVEEGNVAMTIWMGKQILGQRERYDAEVNVKEGEMTLDQLLTAGAQLLEISKKKQ